MSHPPLRRALALILCCSPLLWMSDVARAQSLQHLMDPRAGGGMSGLPGGMTGGMPGGMTDPPPQATQPPAEPMPTPRLPATESFRGPDPIVGAASAGGQVPIDEPLDPERYVCGPGDVLQLELWGLQNSRIRITVDLEGRAFVPRIGFLVLGGKTLAQARRELGEAVARNYPRLSFDVSLQTPRTFLVHVVAGVAQPGAYPARATDRVSSVVARAGGPVARGSRRVVELRRRDGAVLQVDQLRYALTGDVRDDPHLLDGDVVRVPYEDVAATIEGAVNRPGRYELVGSRDLAELIEIAGGLAASATRRLPLTLVRRADDERRVSEDVPFGEGGALPALALRHDDAVRVPDVEALQRSVTVTGALRGVQPPAPMGTIADDPNANRRLGYVAGDTAGTLLDRAGGPAPQADLAAAYLVREGKPVPVDLRAVVMLRDLSADRPVEIGDALVVPFQRRSVIVRGAVYTPGPYPHDPNRTVEEYVALAGGPNRFAASLSKARVVTAEGDVLEFRRGLTVPPGGSVVVAERAFSQPEVVQILISAASVLVSGVAVMLAARR